MAFAAAHERLFIATRRPARLMIIDTRRYAVIAETACTDDSDDLFYDPQTDRSRSQSLPARIEEIEPRICRIEAVARITNYQRSELRHGRTEHHGQLPRIGMIGHQRHHHAPLD